MSHVRSFSGRLRSSQNSEYANTSLILRDVTHVLKDGAKINLNTLKASDVCIAFANSGGDGQGGIVTTRRAKSLASVIGRRPDAFLSHVIIAACGPAPPAD